MSNSIDSKKALNLPIYNKLKNKRIILASSSERRINLLKSIGINPEVIPSRFKEDLDHETFNEFEEIDLKGIKYSLTNSTEKAIEVYTRLVEESPENGPDLVIGSDTIIQSYIPKSNQASIILEKPRSKSDQFKTLKDLVSSDEDKIIEVITSITLVYPSLLSPGFKLKHLSEKTRIWFGDLNDEDLLAYVENGEGIDKAGGFAIQGIGSQFIKRIHGDYNNVVGFPIYAFLSFIKSLINEDDEFLSD
ncbi:inosine triphosphate pyrophosphatase-like protein [Melampsora americana]|nr:inosine triphosphate pyrophosphatase-like protein [Melampsora americana]